MKSKSYKAVFRQYYISCGLIIICYLIIVYLCMRFLPGWWYIVPSIALYFPYRFLIRIAANKAFIPVLINDLNPAEFHRIINSDRRLIPPLSYRIHGAVFTGDHQTVVNISSLQMQKKRCSVKEKYFYLSLLARTYFELRDFEKLKVLLAKYREIKGLYPQKKYQKAFDSVWRYYEYFLDENYEACKTVCKERHLGLNPKAWDFKIRKLQNDFFYAVACYENKDIDESKKSFESIISFAPKMYAAVVSRKYLDAIEYNQNLSLFDTAVLPDETYQIYDEKSVLRIRRSRIVKRIALILIGTSFIFNGFSYFREQNEISAFERKLNAALTEEYNQFTRLTYFNLKKDGESVDSLCLVLVHKSLILVEVVSDNGGETFGVLEISENIIPDTYYCDKSPASDYYIGCVLSGKEPSGDVLYYSTKLALNGNTYWFYIDFLEMFPRS